MAHPGFATSRDFPLSHREGLDQHSLQSAREADLERELTEVHELHAKSIHDANSWRHDLERELTELRELHAKSIHDANRWRLQFVGAEASFQEKVALQEGALQESRAQCLIARGQAASLQEHLERLQGGEVMNVQRESEVMNVQCESDHKMVVTELLHKLAAVEEAVHGKDLQLQELIGKLAVVEEAIHGKDLQLQELLGKLAVVEEAVHGKDLELSSVLDAVHGKDLQLQELLGRLAVVERAVHGKDLELSSASTVLAAELQTRESTELALERASSQIEEERQAKTCCVCMETERQVLFMPCRHIACCARCASTLQQCPIDRAPVEAKIEFINA